MNIELFKRCGPSFEWQLNLQWEPRDLWVGAFWRIRRVERLTFFHLYICLLPLLPFHLTVLDMRAVRRAVAEVGEA